MTVAERLVVVTEPAPGAVVSEPGPQGPPGTEHFYIGPTRPPRGPELDRLYLWAQTGQGADGTGVVLWLEDGAEP